MSNAGTWQAGAAKREIRFSGEGMGMMGYGRSDNVVRGRATPLYSRAFCFVQADGQAVFFAQAEICMIFPEIKRAVLERLQQRQGSGPFRDETVMLVSQHTHSAPGGFSHFPFYNFSIPGFRPSIFEAIVDSLAEAIAAAWAARQPARLRFTHGDFPEDADVAFNRSLAAYNRNPGVTPLPDHQTHKAIERTMWLLLAETLQGTAIGQINWFGVHPTSIGNRNTLVSYDNKGYAAEAVEQALGGDAVAIFAQQFAGDVSPNAQGRTRPSWPKGRYADDHESARFNGRLQSEQALRLLQGMSDADELRDGRIDAATVRRNLADVECDPDFTGGLRGERTSAPCHGLAFFGGSPVDGPGAPKPVLTLLRVLAQAHRWREARRLRRASADERAAAAAREKAQAPKLIVSESATGSLLGMSSVQGLPGVLDPILQEMQRQERAGALVEKPWVPEVLPLQYLRIGELAIIGFPGEITTEAGRQLRALCLEVLAPSGVRNVVVSSYANAYFGYCTTYDEYQEQLYEGGHTTFGNRTHDAFRTEYRRFLRECLRPREQRQLSSAQDKVFSVSTLRLRTFAEDVV